jgi:serine/threonine-protein kinase RsbW
MPDDPQDPGGSQDEVIRLVLRSDARSVRAALRELLVTSPMRRLPEADRDTAEIVLAEVLNNIGEHAYALAGGEIEVTVRHGAEGLVCTVIDRGVRMPGAKLPAGDLHALPPALADMPEGGFGWHLIRMLARDLTYRRMPDHNELRFRLSPDQSSP